MKPIFGQDGKRKEEIFLHKFVLEKGENDKDEMVCDKFRHPQHTSGAK